MMCFLVFFKQKTAYEMRISDWSSDVCSSDLWFPHDPRRQAPSTAPPVRPAASHGGPHRDHGGDARAAADGIRKANGRNLHGPPAAVQCAAHRPKQREKPEGLNYSPKIPANPPIFPPPPKHLQKLTPPRTKKSKSDREGKKV